MRPNPRVATVLFAVLLALTFALPGKTAFSQTASGIITTVVGSTPCHATQVRGEQVTLCGGGFSGDGGPAGRAELRLPAGLAIDASDNLFIADRVNHRIRRVDARTGIITTVAGNSVCPKASVCIEGFSGDGGRATAAELKNPGGLAVDADGNLFIADTGNNRIRRVDHATGIITTVAGKSTAGFSNDGKPATGAELHGPEGVAVDSSGNLFIADTGNNRVRRVDKSTGVINTVAGNGSCCSGPGLTRGDGGLAISAALAKPYGVLVDASGNLFVADFFNYSIRRVDHATGIIATIAGNLCHDRKCGPGFSGDDGFSHDAQLSDPSAIAMDEAGNLFIADSGNRRIRRVDHATGIITTVAGSVGCEPAHCYGSFGGDDGPATSAILSFPFGLAVDAKGNLFISDTGNNRVRKVTAELVGNAPGIPDRLEPAADAVAKK